MTRRRSDMRPGTVFGLSGRSWMSSFRHDEALVVVDSKTEVGFWTGSKWSLGDVTPGLCFEVLCEAAS